VSWFAQNEHDDAATSALSRPKEPFGGPKAASLQKGLAETVQ